MNELLAMKIGKVHYFWTSLLTRRIKPLSVTGEGVGAVNLEEDVLATETGCRNISPSQTEIFYVK